MQKRENMYRKRPFTNGFTKIYLGVKIEVQYFSHENDTKLKTTTLVLVTKVKIGKKVKLDMQ